MSVTSGAFKRRKKIEKAKRDEKVINQTSKLTEWLKTPDLKKNDYLPEEIVSDENMATVSHSDRHAGTISETKDVGCGESHMDKPTSQESFFTDLGKWPEKISTEFRLYWRKKDFTICQHHDEDFSKSKVQTGSGYRYCSRSHFSYVNPLTGMRYERSWLCYSPSEKAVFCFHCKLFNESGISLSEKGFRDWKNASSVLSAHEKSERHQSSVKKFLCLSSSQSRIDTQLCDQSQVERQ